MFEHTSRYNSLDTAFFTDSHGQVLEYKRRRFLPDLSTLQILGEVKVVEGDRIDVIAGRALHAAELFWMICDGNSEMNPAELTARVGRRLRVPAPQAQDAISMLGKAGT